MGQWVPIYAELTFIEMRFVKRPWDITLIPTSFLQVPKKTLGELLRFIHSLYELCVFFVHRQQHTCSPSWGRGCDQYVCRSTQGVGREATGQPYVSTFLSLFPFVVCSRERHDWHRTESSMFYLIKVTASLHCDASQGDPLRMPDADSSYLPCQGSQVLVSFMVTVGWGGVGGKE